jgi:hypothetical protein
MPVNAEIVDRELDYELRCCSDDAEADETQSNTPWNSPWGEESKLNENLRNGS